MGIHLDVEVLPWCDGLVALRSTTTNSSARRKRSSAAGVTSFWPITYGRSTSSSAVTGARCNVVSRSARIDAAGGQLAVPEVRDRQRLRQHRRPSAAPLRPVQWAAPAYDSRRRCSRQGRWKIRGSPSRHAIRVRLQVDREDRIDRILPPVPMVASDPTAADPRPGVRTRLPQRPPGGRPGHKRGRIPESAAPAAQSRNGERNERAPLRLQEVITPADPEVGRGRPRSPATAWPRSARARIACALPAAALDKLIPLSSSHPSGRPDWRP